MTETPKNNVEAGKTRISPTTGWSVPIFNDRIIKDGMPDGWVVQDRLDSNEALLCAPSVTFGSQCVCLRPKAMTTDSWLPTARQIANALAEPPKDKLVGVIEAAERLANAADDMATAANMGLCDEAIEQVREAIAAYRANGGGA